MSDIAALLAEGRRALVASETASLDAELLLAHALGKSREYLYTWPERGVDEEGTARFRHLLQCRSSGHPLAYLVGHREFWSLELAVDGAVLIPRADTECLVEAVLDRFDSAPRRVVDLGTGSGAIALALASERPAWTITATDSSVNALVCASGNADRLQLPNLDFLASDWCTELPSAEFDLVVSNPPYIAADDPHLKQGDLRFEPLSALASGADGLDDIRHIVAQVPRVLRAGGWLFLEHGYDQGEAVRLLLAEGGFDSVHTWHDLAGHERASGARKSS